MLGVDDRYLYVVNECHQVYGLNGGGGDYGGATIDQYGQYGGETVGCCKKCSFSVWMFSDDQYKHQLATLPKIMIISMRKPCIWDNNRNINSIDAAVCALSMANNRGFSIKVNKFICRM